MKNASTQYGKRFLHKKTTLQESGSLKIFLDIRINAR